MGFINKYLQSHTRVFFFGCINAAMVFYFLDFVTCRCGVLKLGVFKLVIRYIHLYDTVRRSVVRAIYIEVHT